MTPDGVSQNHLQIINVDNACFLAGSEHGDLVQALVSVRVNSGITWLIVASKLYIASSHAFPETVDDSLDYDVKYWTCACGPHHALCCWTFQGDPTSAQLALRGRCCALYGHAQVRRLRTTELEMRFQTVCHLLWQQLLRPSWCLEWISWKTPSWESEVVFRRLGK